jgi:hypothetical protein
MGIGVALIGGFLVYGLLKATVGIRLSEEDEFRGADLSIHKLAAPPDFEKSYSTGNKNNSKCSTTNGRPCVYRAPFLLIRIPGKGNCSSNHIAVQDNQILGHLGNFHIFRGCHTAQLFICLILCHSVLLHKNSFRPVDKSSIGQCSLAL